jgi:hypothetical protein
MKPRATCPTGRVDASESTPSRPWRSPARVRWHAHARHVALSSAPEPTTYGQKPLASSPRKSPAAVCLAARLRPHMRAHAIRAQLSTSRHPEPSH